MFRSPVRRFAASIATALGAFVGAIGGVQPGYAGEELRYFHLLSGNAAGTGYAMAESIAAVISGPPGAPSCSLDSRCGVSGLIGVAQSSPGPMTSLDLVAKGLADAALVRASLINHATNRSDKSEAKLADLRHVSNVGTHQLHVIVSESVVVDTIADLQSYRIGVGSPRSEVPRIAAALFGVAGMNVKAMDLRSVSDVDAATLMAVGKLDAMIFVGQGQTRFVADIVSSGIGIDMPIDEAVLDELAMKVKGTYKMNLPNPDREDTWRQVLAFPVSLVVNKGTSASLVSSVLNAIWWKGNQTQLEANGLGPLSLAQAFELIQLPLHEGAGDYFADRGGLPRGVIVEP